MGNSAPAPPFSLETPRYDQSEFVNRARHFYSVLDVRTLFTSKAELARCCSILQHFKQGTLPPTVTNEELWHARKIKESMVHPETGETVFPLFRFAAFAPVNIPIATGLLIPNPAVSTVLFWQWVNQSYNAAVNYANRNASVAQSGWDLAGAYTAATATSCAIAVGLGVAAKKVSQTGRGATLVRATVPFTAVALSGCVNLGLTRKAELQHGEPTLNTTPKRTPHM